MEQDCLIALGSNQPTIAGDPAATLHAALARLTGNPLAAAAGLAAIRAYRDEGLIEQAAARGAYLRAQLDAALADCVLVREVRSLGLMVGIELRQKVGPYLKQLMEAERVIALPAGSNVLRLLPPLIISEDEIDAAARAIRNVLTA